MNEIHDKIRQAQRRLWLNRWLGHLGWSLAGAAGLFVLFVLVVRLTSLFPDEGWAMWWALGGLAGASLIASLLWTLLTRDNLNLAAARLDEAAGLKERLSTALHFAGSADPFARAAVADANKISRLVTPKIYLPVRLPVSAPFAGVAFVAALLFFWLFPAIDISGRQAARAEAAQKQIEVQKAQAQVKPVVDRLRNLQEKHPRIKNETSELDPLQTAKLDTPGDFKQQAIKQVNAAAAKLDQQKNQAGLAKVEEFKSMLRRLAAQPAPSSVVGKLSKSLAQGDFKTAQATLEMIQQELSKEAKTPEEQAHAEQLRKDLKQVSDQLGKIAESTNKVKDQLRQMNLSEEEIKQLVDKLDKGELNEISKQLAEKGLSKEQIDKAMKQMEKSAEARKAASRLAQALAQAADQQKKKQGDKSQNQGAKDPSGKNQPSQQDQDGQQGQQSQQNQEGQQAGQGQQGEGQGQGSQGAADQDAFDSDGFEQANEQLSEMESLQQQMAELNAASAELRELKDQLGYSGEGGEGNPEQQGGGMGSAGIGEGGVAPKQETTYATTPERTRVHTMQGSIIDQRFVQGEQYKGEVTDDFVEAALGAREDLTDVSRQKTSPRHIKLRQAQYFKRVEADLPKDKVDAIKKKLEAEAPAPANQP